jgi:CheY-like chemotaxis protein
MTANILWADDEIDRGVAPARALPARQRLHRGYREQRPRCRGWRCSKEEYDIIFLDENMPGLSGLETLNRIKLIQPACR